MSATLRVGILGMGGMGWFHAARYGQIPGAQVAAIADVRPERLDARNTVQINIENQAGPPDLSGARCFSTAEALIEQADVDVIDICLPSFLHACCTIQALESGRHVLCEKPMALNVEDADAMISAARKAGRKLMIAQCIRFWPEYRFLRQTIRQGVYGDLLSLNLYRVSGRPTGWGWQDWFSDPKRSGGLLYDLHIHDVDFVNSLFGAPDRIVATGRRPERGSASEIIHAIFQYRHGPQVSIHAGWSQAQIPFKAGYDAWFQKGYVRLDSDHTPALAVYADPAVQKEQPASYTPGDAYLNEIEYFIKCVRAGQEPLECPPESARDSLVLLARERAAIDTEEDQ